MELAVGFTGTQRGLRPEQLTSLCNLLLNLGLQVADVPPGLPSDIAERLGRMHGTYDKIIAHHGWCVGADDQFDVVVRLLPRSLSHVVLWPAKGLPHKRGVLARPTDKDAIMPEMDPLQRNREIVTMTKFLIACPWQDHMVQRSGTWTTVRYALASRKPVLVVLPNGVVKEWTL